MLRAIGLFTLAVGLGAVWPAVGRSQTLLTPQPAPSRPGPLPGQLTRDQAIALFGGLPPAPPAYPPGPKGTPAPVQIPGPKVSPKPPPAPPMLVPRPLSNRIVPQEKGVQMAGPWGQQPWATPHNPAQMGQVFRRPQQQLHGALGSQRPTYPQQPRQLQGHQPIQPMLHPQQPGQLQGHQPIQPMSYQQ